MKKNSFLTKTFVAAVLAVAVAGCGNDFEYTGQSLSEEDALANAEEQLDITIDPSKSWAMTTSVEATVTVNKDYGENYTVTVYQNNPFVDNNGVVLGEAVVKNGEKGSFDFTVPNNLYMVFVAVKDSKGYSYVKPVAIVNGKLEAVFGETTRGVADDFDIPTAAVPFTQAQITNYLNTATEPNDANINHNNDNSYYENGTEGHWVDGTYWGWQWQNHGGWFAWNYNSALSWGATQEEKDFFDTYCAPYINGNYSFYNGATTQNDAVTVMIGWIRNAGYGDWLNVWQEGSAGHYEEGTEGHWVTDTDWVLNFKITGNYDKQIPVLASEDVYENGQLKSRAHRDVYITGKWTLPSGEQRVGGNATIVVANGGELVVPANALMYYVNQARLVVMPGGKISGEGSITFTNGTAEDGYGYNGGTINIGKFTNNFGTFFNYGDMTVGTLEGPSTNSLYINHKKMVVNAAPKGSNTANLRLYNNCWFECTTTFACRNIVQGNNAYLKTNNLEMSCGNDATVDLSYLYAKDNSLLEVTGAAAFNNVNIIGPTGSNYAFLQFAYVEDAQGTHNLATVTNYTISDGVMTTAISNNVYLSIDNLDVSDNPYGLTACEKVINMLNGTNTYEYNKKMADPYAKQGAVLYTQVGNGNAVLVQKGQYNTAAIAASECSPGITPTTPTPIVTTYPIYSYAFEDTNGGDYDMNDVVIRAQETAEGKIQLTVVASGATLELNLRLYPAAEPQTGEVAHYEGQYTELEDDKYHAKEVHAMMGAPLEQGQTRCIMLNTGVTTNEGADALPAVITIDKGSYNPACLPLAIYSVKQGEMRLARTGQPPFGIIIPGNWQWPTERVNIMNAYSNTNTASEGDQSFRTFALSTQANVAAHWYNYPVRNVMSK